MPLDMENELRFPMGTTSPMVGSAVKEFLSLVKKVSFNQQQVIEIFKQHFCKVSGDSYAQSSSIGWAESDMNIQAHNASKDAPNFIAAVYDAFEELDDKGATVPNETNLNQILSNHQMEYEIIDKKLVQTGGNVAAPEICESVSTTVSRALRDAKSLIGTADASSAIDRAHTALHGYLVQLCHDSSIGLPKSPTVSKAYKSLRESHAALQVSGHRAEEVTRVLNSFATSIDAFSTLRNQASLAHVNELLDVPEATVIVNAMYTIFRYIQDCMRRHAKNSAYPNEAVGNGLCTTV